jgi:predicted neutral ceramidase superfamily lipid hydrolase
MTTIAMNPVGAAPFAVGASISKTFRIFGKGWWKFFVLTLVPMAPYYIYQLVTQPLTPQAAIARQMQMQTHLVAYLVGMGVSFIVGIALQSLAYATCLYGAYETMRGKDFSIAESFSVGLGRLAPVLGTAVAVGILTGLASLLLVVPGAIVYLMMYVALPVCVVERLGPFDSVRRSRLLTKGSRWKILGLLLLMCLAIMIVGAVFGGIGAALAGLRGYAIGAGLVSVLIYSFFAVLAAVVYHDLRVAKEGVDIETLTSVFE